MCEGSGISKRKVESEYGERIMKMMGYTGGGLGLTGEGRLEPIQVGRLEDNEGVSTVFN
jgi:G-patch domain